MLRDFLVANKKNSPVSHYLSQFQKRKAISYSNILKAIESLRRKVSILMLYQSFVDDEEFPFLSDVKATPIVNC